MTRGGKREGAGAPKGPRVNSATTWLQIRVNTQEKQAIKDRAVMRGVSVSEFVKICTLSGKDE